MLLCACVQDYFRTYLIQQRGYGENTLASYRDTFKLLVAFLKGAGLQVDTMDMLGLDSSLVNRFLSWLESDRGNSVSTRNVRLAHLKSFASYVSTISPDDLGACAEVSSVPAKRQVALPPDSLSREEVSILLSEPGTTTKWGLRDSAMLALLYDSACRAQELADVDACHVALRSPCCVRVVGKGRKGRRVPLMNETGRLVASYMEAFRIPEGSERPLFVNRGGTRLTRAGVSNVVERHWRRAAEANPDVAAHHSCRPHLLRHSKATHLVEENVSIYYVRDFLGHSSVETTQVYLKSNVERMRSAIQSAALKTVGNNNDYYTEEKRATLLEFLENLL